jgi:hypothetical protein
MFREYNAVIFDAGQAGAFNHSATLPKSN